MPHLNNSKILFLGFCGEEFFEVTQKMQKNLKSFGECIVIESEIIRSMPSF